MTRIVEASPQVLVMRNPKTESKAQFMDRAEKLADALWVEPAPVVEETVEEAVDEIIVEVRAIGAELDYLRWFYQNADFGPADSDVRWRLNKQYVAATGNPLPVGYQSEEEE